MYVPFGYLVIPLLLFASAARTVTPLPTESVTEENERCTVPPTDKTTTRPPQTRGPRPGIDEVITASPAILPPAPAAPPSSTTTPAPPVPAAPAPRPPAGPTPVPAGPTPVPAGPTPVPAVPTPVPAVPTPVPGPPPPPATPPENICKSNDRLGICKVACASKGGAALPSSDCTGDAVCCSIPKATCDYKVSTNIATYWTSPNNGPCKATISLGDLKTNTGKAFCQVKVFLLGLRTPAPDAQGQCSNKLIAEGDIAIVPSPMCSASLGNFYLQTVNGGDMAVTVSGFEWYVDIIPIPCSDTNYLAPSGCTQYYTEPTGTIMSNSYDRSANSAAFRQLANQNEVICFKKKETSALKLEACPADYTKVLPPFALTGDTNTEKFSLTGKTDCPDSNDYMTIPGAGNSDDRICGNRFNPVSRATTEGTVIRSRTTLQLMSLLQTRAMLATA